MVWLVLEQLDRGLTWNEILREWQGKFPKTAIAEAIAIAHLVVKNQPFKGFNGWCSTKTYPPASGHCCVNGALDFA